MFLMNCRLSLLVVAAMLVVSPAARAGSSADEPFELFSDSPSQAGDCEIDCAAWAQSCYGPGVRSVCNEETDTASCECVGFFAACQDAFLHCPRECLAPITPSGRRVMTVSCEPEPDEKDE